MSERQIDDAIDHAVRDLMNVDADSAFRARVAERLHQPKPRGHVWRQLAIASATAAAIVIGVAMWRDKPAPANLPTPGLVASAPTAPPVAAPPVPPAPVASREPRPAPARTRPSLAPTQRIARGTLVATVAGDPLPADGPPESAPGGVEPVDPIASIEVEPIAQKPIVTAAITITPLAPISELVIAPLNPRIERD